MSPNPILVQALRGGVVESFHRGAVALVDADGGVLARCGDIERPIFPRSAVKVLQALPLVASGAADAFALTDEELALACASHNGEPRHADTAAGVLARLGLDAGALECGTHWPMHEPTMRALAATGGQPCALHNNCSGKHAGFVCLGSHLAGHEAPAARAGWLAGYVRPDHPVMREVDAALRATTGWNLAHGATGIDGCSIPTHAIPLRHLAQAFARVGTGVGLSEGHARAAHRLRQAVARAPWAVAGTDRFDTRVMERLGERVFCKVGAEGVYCAAFPELGLGVALKMDDGNTARAAEVVMAALIAAWLPLDEAERGFIEALADLPLRNWSGIGLGRLQATGEVPQPA